MPDLLRLVLILGLLTRATLEAGLQGVAATPPSLDHVAFMTGTWCSAPDPRGTVIEEHYTTPTRNLMLGLTRYLRDGSTIAYEFSRLEITETGVVLTAMPSAQQATPFTLAEMRPGQAVFENPGHDFPVRVIYRRTEERLTARIEGSDGDGQEWEMTSCPGGAGAITPGLGDPVGVDSTVNGGAS